MGKFDVSEKQNETIMAYYYESSVSGTYDFYIGSVNDVVYANPNSRYVFAYMTNLVSINGMENFDTSNVTNMGYMFAYCNSLTTIDVSHFNTLKVLSMGGMFNDCSSLTILDLSNFDTSKAEYMTNIFSNCNKLNTLNISNFSFERIKETDKIYVFSGVSKSCDVIVGSKEAKEWIKNNFDIDARIQ